MRTLHIFYLILLGTAVACSGREEETTLPPAPVAATQNIRFSSEAVTDYTVSAFREGGNGFVYLNSFASSGRTDGRTDIQLPVGNYKFLVATGYGHSILLSPQSPEQGTTRFEELKFVAQTTDGSNLQAGEELFLPDTLVDSVYRLQTATTIELNLERAMAQTLLYIKRGRKTGENQFVAIPYEQDSIVRYFSQIDLQLENVASSIDVYGTPEGEASMRLEYPATAYDSITSEGFAAYTGPFFFPPIEKKPLQFLVKLLPSADSPQPELSLTSTGKVGRNERLVITVWITNDWNFIGVTADTHPIQKEQDGDTGIWDNTVTSAFQK